MHLFSIRLQKMHTHFSLFKRKTGIFYMQNKIAGQHKTLRTRDRTEAQKLVQAHNDTANQPIFNLAWRACT